MSDFESSAAEPTPITEFDEEESYDIVVIGAGTGGVPAAIAAYEAGANVCLIQKEVNAVAQGTGCCYLNPETTDELAAKHLMHSLRTAPPGRLTTYGQKTAPKPLPGMERKRTRLASLTKAKNWACSNTPKATQPPLCSTTKVA